MMGDNRDYSDDSRFWGPVPRAWIIGKRSSPTGRPTGSASSSARARRSARRRASGHRLFAFDRALAVRLVAGADEAGRGCLAGPLVAAAVLFDYAALTTRELRSLSALNDSKQHDHAAREELYPRVLACARRVVVVSRSVRSIDDCGLHVTNLAALRDALRGVAGPGVLCLIDGFAVPEFGFEQRAIVDGDATSAAIAAASIVAKVTRDRFMRRADERHPGWSSRRTSATRRPSIAPRSRARASRRCTGCRSSRAPTSSSRCSRSRHVLELLERDERAAAVEHDRDGVDPQRRRAGPGRVLDEPRGGERAHPPALDRGQRRAAGRARRFAAS